MKTISNTIKIIWLSSLFALTCPVMGQVGQTPKLDLEALSGWSTLESVSISDKGNWMSYTLTYESGNDTLFVKNVHSQKTIAFPAAGNGRFRGEEQFSCKDQSGTFKLLNLKTSRIEKLENVQEYDFIANGKWIVLIRTIENKQQLEIRDTSLKLLKAIADVNHYSLNPLKKALVYQQKQESNNKVIYMALEEDFREYAVMQSQTENFQNFVWHSSGASLVFVNSITKDSEAIITKLIYYNFKTKTTKVFDVEEAPDWPKDMIITSSIAETLDIVEDEGYVFFNVKKKMEQKAPSKEKEIEIWNTADKDLYEYRKRYGNTASQNRLALWDLQNNTFKIVGSEEIPGVMLLPNQKKGILMANNLYKPQPKYTPDADYYLVDVLSAEKTLLIEKGEGDWSNIEFSPSGKYIMYFKQDHWWLYDVASKTHRNLTKDIATLFMDEDNDKPEVSQPYGIAAWTNDEKSVLVYDKYDVWQISLIDNSSKKLTDGREQDIIFRFDKQSLEKTSVAFSKPILTVNLEEELILHGIINDFSKSGYFVFRKGKGVQPLVFENRKITQFKRAKEGKNYLFVQEKYNEPPSVVLGNQKTGNVKVVFKSNPQHEKYRWGKSELIEYTTAKGQKLKGILFYPFDYDPNKQYPMVVHIYQRQLGSLHTYMNPSLHNSAGFNKTNFTSQGYFVHYPDIVYQIGSPGFSAVDCVEAATKAAIAKAPINAEKIGLIGHSFGGYQTNFIITQTDMFKTAVSGCGVSNTISFYLSVGWSYAKGGAWRFEEDQLRMKSSLFENREGYHKNSPIEYAEKITTPLLSWTGGSDTQVDAVQSFDWYSALRRLKKENVLLVYPNEGHVLVNENYQKDLSIKEIQWFDYYLKDGKQQPWMIPQ